VPQDVDARLGTPSYGTLDTVGNILLYPRRLILSALKLALSAPNLFTTTATEGRDQDRNPFLYVEDAVGGVSPESRIVLSDSGAEFLTNADRRPRIIVDRGPGRFINGGLATRNYTGPGLKTFVDSYETTLIVYCRGRTKLESEALTQVAITTLWFARDRIKERANLQSIGAPNISTTTAEKHDAVVDQYVTTLELKIMQTVCWSNSPLNTTMLFDICVDI
jgi:hypothetical protein